MSKTIIIDPGHGGFDAGATFEDRKEKEDSLKLALAVGRALENDGYTVYYTRTDDRYDSPYDKAQFANNTGGDLFLSFHRNAAQQTDQYQGVQALVYDKDPLALRVGKYVNENLEKIGFRNIGIESRKELVVLRRTAMPAVLLEVGFVNSAEDNRLFDERFAEITDAIADGVKEALPHTAAAMETKIAKTPAEPEAPEAPPSSDDVPLAQKLHAAMYRSLEDVPDETDAAGSGAKPSAMPEDPFRYYVQVGLFRYPENAVYLMEQLKQQGYDAVWNRVGGLIAIWAGPRDTLDEAVTLQRSLMDDGYETLIVSDHLIRR